MSYCSAYHAEFATYAIILSYDEQTKKSFFTEGASQGLKDARSYQISLPDNFDEFIKVCNIKLDNNARLRSQPHHRTTPAAPKPSSAAPSSTAAGSTAADPMDLSYTDRIASGDH